jgi:hypothetical protein
MLQPGTANGATSRPGTGLLMQFLEWIAAHPRSYRETMEAWRSSCPRLSIWEDALADGLVQVRGHGVRTQGEAKVTLTPAGKQYLAQEADAATTVQPAPARP